MSEASRTPETTYYAVYRGYIVTANKDGSIPIKSKVIAQIDPNSEKLATEMVGRIATLETQRDAALERERGLREALKLVTSRLAGSFYDKSEDGDHDPIMQAVGKEIAKAQAALAAKGEK